MELTLTVIEELSRIVAIFAPTPIPVPVTACPMTKPEVSAIPVIVALAFVVVPVRPEVAARVPVLPVTMRVPLLTPVLPML